MRKNMTEIVFILDRSGSMSGLETDTIGGFNSMIEKQKKENGEALISTVLFDNVSEVIHDRVPVQKVEPMTDRDYSVRGCTALLDAIGGAIHHIGNVHKYARNEDVPEHTLFVITTDGMELMTQDEIAVMDGGKCILQLRGVRPFLSDKYDITKHPNYKYLSDFDKRNAFDVERYMSTRPAIVKPDEAFDIYEIDLSDEDAAAEE